MIREGIVLRHFIPFKQLISLLDAEHGSLRARVTWSHKYAFLEKISAGSVVTYHFQQRNGRCPTIEIVQLLDMPFELARSQLSFLHHLFELCSFFLPLECPTAGGVYELVRFVYTVKPLDLTAGMQKLLLFRFFLLVGTYPEGKLFKQPYIYTIRSCMLSELIGMPITKEVECLLDTWLIHCVREHPMVSSFKTVRFLDEVRVL